jgi:hypothetical protein
MAAGDDQEKVNPGPPTPTSERQRSFFGRNSTSNDQDVEDFEEDKGRPTKWGMGVLNDRETHEVPGMNGSLQRLAS